MSSRRGWRAAAGLVGVVALLVSGLLLRWAGLAGGGLVVATLLLGSLLCGLGAMWLVPSPAGAVRAGRRRVLRRL